MIKAASIVQEEPVIESAIRVIKSDTCPSLSGRSTLTYHVGASPESVISIRVFANSGGGFFNRDWVEFKTLQQVLEKRTGANPVTSSAFGELFPGKSVNTTGFLLAVLKHIALVKPLPDKPRCYEFVDPGPWLAEMEALMASSVAETPDTSMPSKPSPPVRKGGTKVKAIYK